MHEADDLMKCDPPAGCQGCSWRPVAEEVCRGVCIGEQDICPWLMACRCANPDQSTSRGRSLERLVLAQPASVQVASVDVPKRWVRLGQYEIRQRRSEETIRQLASSIATNGLFSPPGGVASPSGHIDILMGANRTLAMLSVLNWPKVPVRVFHWSGTDDWERKIAAFHENALRQQLSFDEEVALVYACWQQTGQTVRQLATRFRMSKSWVQERITWGKRVYGDRRASPPSAQGTDAVQLRRKASSRVTFPREEVREWVSELATLGIVADDDDTGTLRDELRRAMQNVICLLRKEAA